MSTITLDVTLHTVGDKECREGWCGISYPTQCKQKGCAGLVHAEFGDYYGDPDEGYYLVTKCDLCGERE